MGELIIFGNNQVSLNFTKNKYDIFDFTCGIEYELDVFVDELIMSISSQLNNLVFLLWGSHALSKYDIIQNLLKSLSEFLRVRYCQFVFYNPWGPWTLDLERN